MIELYDLVGADDRRFSSNCWRTQFALAHKGLAYTTVPTRFCDIKQIADGQFRTIPVIRIGDTYIGDSARIARELETRYPATPSLFGTGIGRTYAAHLEAWLSAAVSLPILRLIIADIAARVDPADTAYFHVSREKRFGMTLEQMTAAPRSERVDAVLAVLAPIRAALADQPFLGGASPLYPDYLIAANLLWARAMSPGPLLPPDDPITAWLGRVLDLFNGLGRRNRREWDGP